MKRIDSAQNPLYRAWKSLLSAKGIKEEGLALVSGRKLVPEFLADSGNKIEALLIFDPTDIEKLAFQRKTEVFHLKSAIFDDIDEAGTHFPMVVVRTPPINPSDLKTQPEGLEVVLALSNPLNMGAALRTCEAFGVRKVILLEECAHPFLPKVIRASSGSSLRLSIERGPSAAKLSDEMTKYMTALDMEGDDIMETRFSKNVRLFIGEEGRGIPPGEFSKKIRIPIKEGMDSLNAVAAASIALYAMRAQN